MEPIKKRLKPRGHFIEDRRKEIFVGILMFMIGALLMYDAFEGRGKPIPWPANKFTPW
jgi:hypothetical protein